MTEPTLDPTVDYPLSLHRQDLLFTPNGKPIATWKANKDGQKTDWKAAFTEVCQIAQVGELCGQLIEAHTKTTPGARPFLLK